jgi:hypothetical protein
MNEKTKKKLAEALMPIPKVIPRVNEGGCGVFALELSRALWRRGVRSAIIEIGCIYHFVVKVGKTYFEAGGVFARDEPSMKCNARNRYGTDQTRTVRKDRFTRLVADERRWNPRFDRDSYGETLARLIENAVEEIVGPVNTHARDLIELKTNQTANT